VGGQRVGGNKRDPAFRTLENREGELVSTGGTNLEVVTHGASAAGKT
jgi:hypothetical protein